MNIKEWLLPESCHGSGLLLPEAIVLHYLSAINTNPEEPFSVESCRRILVDYKLSYHFVISRHGDIYKLVSTNKQAWHAGKSAYKGKTGWNRFSLGVCFIGGENTGFTEEQYKSGKELIAWCIDQWPIQQIVGHEDIAGFRGKIDPGIKSGNFDMSRVV